MALVTQLGAWQVTVLGGINSCVIDGALPLLFELLDPERFNKDVRKEAAAAALSLLEPTLDHSCGSLSNISCQVMGELSMIAHHSSALTQHLEDLPSSEDWEIKVMMSKLIKLTSLITSIVQSTPPNHIQE